MTDITVNVSQEPNIPKLGEELDVLSLGVYSMSYPSSYPGDMIAQYEGTISAADQTSVSDMITAHDPAINTAEQDRVAQDTTDLDSIRADYDAAADWGTLTDVQKTTAIQEMRRCILRIMRNEAI